MRKNKEMEFYDFHLHFIPDKDWLKKLGFKGGCVFEVNPEREDLIFGEEIKAQGKQELRKKVRKSKADFLVLKEAPDNIILYAIENGVVDCVTDLEKGGNYVPLHHRNSGLNQVIARFAGERQVIIDFNFNNIIHSKAKKRARLLSRMRQNIKLCKKYGAPIMLSSGALNKMEMVPAYDLIGFGQVLGLTKGEAKRALNKAQKKILEKVR